MKFHNSIFSNPSNPELNAWCPREAFAKLEANNLDGSSVEFEKIEAPPALKDVIGKEFFNVVLNKLTLSQSASDYVIFFLHFITVNYEKSNLDLLINVCNYTLA